MNAKTQLPTTVTTPRFRVSYPSVFAPKMNDLSKKLEYSVQALFEDSADLTQLKTAAKNACMNKWGSDQKKWPTNLRLPFRSQKELIASAEKKGQASAHLSPKAVFMVFKTGATDKSGKEKSHPPVVGKNPKERIEEESLFYAGCWAKANVTAGAYEKGGNCGVTFYLNGCQFVGDNEPFSGKPNIESAFEAIPEEITEGAEEGGDATDMFN